MSIRDLRQRATGASGDGGDRSQRVKVIAISVVLVLVLGWLVVTLAPMLRSHSSAKEPDSPGWMVVRRLNAALLQKPAFVDTGFDLVSEKPLKLRLVGGVRSEADLKDLQEYVKELSPEGEYEVKVEVIDEGGGGGDA